MQNVQLAKKLNYLRKTRRAYISPCFFISHFNYVSSIKYDPFAIEKKARVTKFYYKNLYTLKFLYYIKNNHN